MFIVSIPVTNPGSTHTHRPASGESATSKFKWCSTRYLQQKKRETTQRERRTDELDERQESRHKVRSG